MTKNRQNLLSGSKELKLEFLEIASRLPETWISIYVDKFCQNIRGMALINKYNRLQNIKLGKSTPEPSEMRNLYKILEMDKTIIDKAKILEML